jgi:ABC-2 type transport system permease protein
VTAAAIREGAKLGAFLRRDWKIMTSYRLGLSFGVISLGIQAVLFSFIGRVVDPALLPAYGGTRATYVEFVAIGLVVTMVAGLMLDRVANGIRQEQFTGTLEALLTTPTSVATIQVGTAAFELLAVPLRAVLLLGIIAVLFGLDIELAGVLPAIATILAFAPFVWGLGLVSAAMVLTFRRGVGLVGLLTTILGISAGAYFPLSVLPGALATIAEANPLALALESMRGALIGGEGFADLAPTLAILLPVSTAALVAGVVAFRLALDRERRLGTLGLY